MPHKQIHNRKRIQRKTEVSSQDANRGRSDSLGVIERQKARWQEVSKIFQSPEEVLAEIRKHFRKDDLRNCEGA